MLSAKDLARLRMSLFAGKYNLLIGAGVSLDSQEKNGIDYLPTGPAFQKRLCELKKVSTDRPLNRVYQLLGQREIDEHVTKRFSLSVPGKTVRKIPEFIWNRIYTFNIDDALENGYSERAGLAKQTPISINFNVPYASSGSHKEVQVVHLHGYVQEPSVGYVFSMTEYAFNSKFINPWMTVLSQTLATESFIISGTSLAEPDLEYYLSHRSQVSGRQDRGPSILVEPFPDAITENDCKRHGLVLVKATLLDFLTWLQSTLGEPPSLETIVLPSAEGVFSKDIPALTKISFFSAVDIVRPVAASQKGVESGFFFGQSPSWQDLESDLDVATSGTSGLIKKINYFLDGRSPLSNIILVTAEPGTGKSTNLRRIAYDLAKDARTVFFIKKTCRCKLR